MKLYDIIRLLNSNGFVMIHHGKNYEVWEKNRKSLTIPTTYDTLNLRLAKDLKHKISTY